MSSAPTSRATPPSTLAQEQNKTGFPRGGAEGSAPTVGKPLTGFSDKLCSLFRAYRRRAGHNVPFPASGKLHQCPVCSSPHKGAPLWGPRSACGAQIPHSQPERYFLPGTRPGRKWIGLYSPTQSAFLCEAFLTRCGAEPKAPPLFLRKMLFLFGKFNKNIAFISSMCYTL